MTLDKVFTPGPNNIFVFGSNDAGIHGAGAALTAHEKYGAEWGFGEGLRGNSYAIPTKTDKLITKDLADIRVSISRFMYCVGANPHLHFFVTRIGCGLAGYKDRDIAPFFQNCPPNVELPHGWDRPETLP